MTRSFHPSIALLSLITACLVMPVGCADQAAAVPAQNESSKKTSGEQSAERTEPLQEDAGSPEVKDASGGGIGGSVSALLDKAKANAPTIDGMKQMLSNAGDATGQTADDTMKWINETYKTLSDSGMTQAKSAGDWVTEDWKSMNAWEYKIVTVDIAKIAADPSMLEQTLNENGKQRWDCFHVSDGPQGTMFYMKRQKKSYLKNIPLRDMLRLVPLLDTGNGP